MSFSLDWHGQRVRMVVDEAMEESIIDIALAVEGKAKSNIVANDQVDTGFLMNSIYTVARRSRNTYGSTQASGKYAGSKSAGGYRRRAPQISLPPSAIALVAAAAAYAIHVELSKSFLFKALQEVARESGSYVRKV
jgi:hypothetical protein